MKTLYHPKNRLKSIYRGKLIFVVILFVFCVIFFSYFDKSLIRGATPIWVIENSFVQGLTNVFRLVRSKQSLIRENEMLKSKVASSELALSVYGGIESQNNLLLETLGRGQKNDYIKASIIARPPKTFFDSIIVDVGENSNIRIDDKVLAPEGAIIGVVSEVFPKNSKIKLFTTSGEITPAYLERESTPVDLKGLGGGVFEASVPRDTKAVMGDRVLSAHIRGELMGVIEEIEMSPTDSFKKLMIRSAVNIFKMHFVNISHE